MAIFTGDEGCFEVTAISFTPRVIALGETTKFSVTLRNISGTKVTSCYISMDGRYPSADAPNGVGATNSNIYLYGGPSFAMHPISWPNGASVTFTGTFTWDLGFYAPDMSSYVLDVSKSKLHLRIVTGQSFSTGRNYDNFFNLRGDSGEHLAVLSRRDNLKLAFDLERYPDDEALTVAASIRLRADVGLDALTAHGYAARLYCSDTNNPATPSDEEVALNATLAQMYAGISGSTSAVTRSFSNGSDWHFLLQVSNGYETRQAACDVPRAFANVHFSGLTTGGACFGGFCKSEAGRPRLESYYPIYPYGGVHGVNIYDLAEVNTGGKWIDGKPIWRRVFTGTTRLSGAQGVFTSLPAAPETVVSLRVMVGANGNWRPVPNTYYGDINWSCSAFIQGADIHLGFGSKWVGERAVIVVVEYTKP